MVLQGTEWGLDTKMWSVGDKFKVQAVRVSPQLSILIGSFHLNCRRVNCKLTLSAFRISRVVGIRMRLVLVLVLVLL